MKKRGNQDGVNYPKNLEYRVGRYFKTQRLDDSSKEAADVEGDYDSSCFIDDRHDDRHDDNDSAGSSAGDSAGSSAAAKQAVQSVMQTSQAGQPDRKGKDVAEGAAGGAGGSSGRPTGGGYDEYAEYDSDGAIVVKWPSTINERHYSFKWSKRPRSAQFLNKHSYLVRESLLLDGVDHDAFTTTVRSLVALLTVHANIHDEDLPAGDVHKAVEAYYRKMIVKEMAKRRDAASASDAESDSDYSDFGFGPEF